MAVDTSANRAYFVAHPPFPALRPTHRPSSFPLAVPSRTHSASSSSVKSERHSPARSDLSLPTLPDFTFHSPGSTPSVELSSPHHADHFRQLSSRFGMAPPHSNHASDGWNFKRSTSGPMHGPGMPIDLGEMSYTDEYDDVDDMGELPTPSNASSHGGQADKVIRRRSSKGMSLVPLPPMPHSTCSMRSMQEKQVQVRACRRRLCLQELHDAWHRYGLSIASHTLSLTSLFVSHVPPKSSAGIRTSSLPLNDPFRTTGVI